MCVCVLGTHIQHLHSQQDQRTPVLDANALRHCRSGPGPGGARWFWLQNGRVWGPQGREEEQQETRNSLQKQPVKLIHIQLASGGVCLPSQTSQIWGGRSQTGAWRWEPSPGRASTLGPAPRRLPPTLGAPHVRRWRAVTSQAACGHVLPPLPSKPTLAR